VADLLEWSGWRGYYLGANVPVDAMQTLIEEKCPDAVALSASLSVRLGTLATAVTEIHKAFPDLPILVGGQALSWGGRGGTKGLPGVHYLKSLDELETWVKEHGSK
jgi:cobalamin-dependent methionine synthase I